ncbi:hypothetical protein C1645_835069 [Glomus cerebriforme]|uniref:Uncharacterized protein n=1 Tax=Glomus cerebriforme TaxID=658196 RepID=A0A397SCQ3_9GLOM|nr:hypothetical protein C1645_835069 [Glomus cerebriforme]
MDFDYYIESYYSFKFQCETSERNDSKEISDNPPMQKNNLREPLQEIDSNNTNLKITMNTNNLVNLINSGILKQDIDIIYEEDLEKMIIFYYRGRKLNKERFTAINVQKYNISNRRRDKGLIASPINFKNDNDSQENKPSSKLDELEYQEQVLALKEREIFLREREANVRVMELTNLEKERNFKLDNN